MVVMAKPTIRALLDTIRVLQNELLALRLKVRRKELVASLARRGGIEKGR